VRELETIRRDQMSGHIPLLKPELTAEAQDLLTAGGREQAAQAADKARRAGLAKWNAHLAGGTSKGLGYLKGKGLAKRRGQTRDKEPAEPVPLARRPPEAREELRHAP
jgi:hypothetical protein